MKYKFLVGMLLLLHTACRDYTPKPVEHNQMHLPVAVYEETVFSKFSFDRSNITQIETLPSPKKGQIWFNIIYPQYHVIIYCSYLDIDKNSLNGAVNDSYHLAYSHAIKADGITQNIYKNADSHTYGNLYKIDGDVATPAQFYLTDSISHFFRGSFYYSKNMNMDSVAPLTEYIVKDIEELMASFKWNNHSK